MKAKKLRKFEQTKTPDLILALNALTKKDIKDINNLLYKSMIRYIDEELKRKYV